MTRLGGNNKSWVSIDPKCLQLLYPQKPLAHKLGVTIVTLQWWVRMKRVPLDIFHKFPQIFGDSEEVKKLKSEIFVLKEKVDYWMKASIKRENTNDIFRN